jgi:putative transposase
MYKVTAGKYIVGAAVETSAEGFSTTELHACRQANHGGQVTLDAWRSDRHRAAASGDAARDWLTVYRLPPYAHELNPVEPVWSHLKRSLANLAKRNLAQLTALVKTRLRRMQYRPSLLDGFLASTRLDLAPP